MDISKLVQDPDWAKVESLLEQYSERVLDIRTIDLKQSAEHVKAELIGRIESYNSMTSFLNDSGIITKKIERIPNPFK